MESWQYVFRCLSGYEIVFPKIITQNTLKQSYHLLNNNSNRRQWTDVIVLPLRQGTTKELQIYLDKNDFKIICQD